MNSKDFFYFHGNGRRDYSNEDLRGLDFFTPSLMLSHKEFFEKELSSLVNEGAEVAFKPIIGVDLNGASLRRAKLIGASFYRANLAEADLEGIDGRYANFIGANLSGANLCGADLRFADFSDAALDGADLKGAKIDHSVFSRANLYKSNIDVVKAVCVDFSQAEMGSSNITNCKFAHTRFSFSDLSNARIVDSGFFRCDLGRIKINEGEVSCVEFSHVNANSILSNSAVFRKVTLDSVDLNGSVINNGLFFECKLSGVDLSFSKISETSFQGSELYRSLLNNVSIFCISFYNSAFGYVSLVDLDLTPFLEADIKHTGPNNVDYMSVTKTIMRDIGHPLDIDSHSKLKDFLVACGMPAVVAMYLIDSIRSLNPEQMVSLMRSTFISYGGPDEEFAKK